MGKHTHEFKGLTDWVEVFRAGDQTDSRGRTRTWTAEDLDQIAANVSSNPPPHVITHKKLFSPFGYGQAVEAKREGDALLVRSDKIEPQFESLVQAGRLYRRSVGIRKGENGWQLDHIAWLGAEPPAVEGLAPVEFAASEDLFEFSYEDEVEVGLWRRLREWLLAKFDQETADQVVPSHDLDFLLRDALRPEPPEDSSINPTFSAPSAATGSPQSGPDHHPHSTGGASATPTGQNPNNGGTHAMGEEHQFSQEDMDAAVQAARSESTSQTSALQAKLDEERRVRLGNEYQAQIDAAIDDGRLTPAQAEGMVEFMLALPGDPDQPFEFSRGEGDAATTEKTTPMSWFEKFVGALGHQVDLSESGAGDDLQPGGHDFAAPVGAAVDASQLATHNRALDYQASHQGVDYLSAVKAVSQ